MIRRNLQDRDHPGFDFSTDFQVESYLNHQGDSFVKRFDANSYLYITKAIDYFDLSKDGSLLKGLEGVKASALIISVSCDWLYPPYQSEEIVAALSANDVKTHISELKSYYGHDTFLLEGGQLNYLLKRFLDRTLVSDVMGKSVPTIDEDMTLVMAAWSMIKKEVNHLPVLTKDRKLCGIVTSWDIAKAVAYENDLLKDIIISPVKTAKEGEPIQDAVDRMVENRISALVVDDEGRVIGLITSDMVSKLVGLEDRGQRKAQTVAEDRSHRSH